MATPEPAPLLSRPLTRVPDACSEGQAPRRPAGPGHQAPLQLLWVGGQTRGPKLPWNSELSVTEAESDPSPPQGSFLDRLSFVS